MTQRTIWKHTITLGNDSMILLPRGARIVRVGCQVSGSVSFWEIHDDVFVSQEDRTFRIFGTGHGIPDNGYEYVGTADDGPFVWHLFEKKPA